MDLVSKTYDRVRSKKDIEANLMLKDKLFRIREVPNIENNGKFLIERQRR